VLVCSACGEENPDRARFCLACGSVLRAPAGGEERKVVTVLFADLTGSTALGESLDPESLKEVMGTYFEAMRQEIEAEGGTVEKFIGDAVMAAFGVPAAHEDDPARALRAALRMRRRLEDLNETLAQDHGLTLQVRTGVNTGEVMAVTAPRPGEAMVSGDAVNVAARLEQAARPDHVVVSERTARATRGFRFGPLGSLELKGKGHPVAALELLGEAVVPERGIPGLRAPMVGRDAELALLQSIYERSSSEGRPNLVTIYGDAGVGKSRLTSEFLAWAEGREPPPLIVRGRCLPYGDGVTYSPLAEILKGQAGVLDTDPPELALEKIRKLGRDLFAAEFAADPARASAAIAYTVGLDDPDVSYREVAPRQVRLEVHAAWRSFFSALAAERAVVVVVEDIHWADQAMLDLLEELADRIHGSAVLLCPSRPELTARRPGWGGGRRSFSSLFLDPLSAAEADHLVGLLLSVEELPESVHRQILDRAEGNPFFLEEIVRQLIDSGHIVRSGERWRAAGEIEHVEIPDTVQAVLAARIDLLEPGDKRALQLAAVVGRVFWPGPVLRLLDGDRPGGEEDGLDETFDRLEDRELVLSRLGSSIAGEREFIFKHVLTRDVAYDTLPRRDRFRAHGEVARWIEETAGQRRREFVELLAHHYSEALAGARQDARTDPDRTEELRRAAFEALLEASDDARRKSALAKAIQLGEEALSVASSGEERAAALESLGWAHNNDYNGDLAWQYMKDAADVRVAEVPDDSRAIARACAIALLTPTRWPGSMKSMIGGQEAESYLNLGLRHAGEADSPELARLLTAKAFWPFAFADLEEEKTAESAEAGRRAADMARRLGRIDLELAALDGGSAIHIARGRYGDLEPLLARRLELIRRVEDPWEAGDTLGVAAWSAVCVGRYPEAVHFGSEGIERASGAPGVGLHCLVWRALASYYLGEWDEFMADFERVEEMLGERRDAPPPFAIRVFGAAALVHDVRENRATAERMMSMVDRLRKPTGGAFPVADSYIAALLARRGRFDEARAQLDRNTGDLESRGMLLAVRCDLVAAAGDWGEARDRASEARAWAAEAGLEALPFYADRLEGRAAAARGDLDWGVELLRQSTQGFKSLESVWEAALTDLSLAEALATGGNVGAREAAAGAAAVFERVGAAAELERAGRVAL
jgi:class 3 adenylate cyclase/tetratricopeptide (TPR) repeat protein